MVRVYERKDYLLPVSGDADGAVSIIARHSIHDAKYPAGKDSMVRVDVRHMGTVVEPLGANGTRITFLIYQDMGFNSTMMSMAKGKFPTEIYTGLSTFIKKRFK